MGDTLHRWVHFNSTAVLILQREHVFTSDKGPPCLRTQRNKAGTELWRQCCTKGAAVISTRKVLYFAPRLYDRRMNVVICCFLESFRCFLCLYSHKCPKWISVLLMCSWSDRPLLIDTCWQVRRADLCCFALRLDAFGHRWNIFAQYAGMTLPNQSYKKVHFFLPFEFCTQQIKGNFFYLIRHVKKKQQHVALIYRLSPYCLKWF